VGDCVVPNAYAFLEGADVNLLMDGVFHSMSRVGTYDDRPETGRSGGYW
jgi:hypothetical protein